MVKLQLKPIIEELKRERVVDFKNLGLCFFAFCSMGNDPD